MILRIRNYLITITSITLFIFLSDVNAAEHPNTSIAIIDINMILNDSDVAIDANKQIEEISNKVQQDIADREENLINEQKKLIEAQSIMAPEAFEEKRIEYEVSVENYQIKSQNTLVKLENTIAIVRAQILDELKPILEEIATDKGITVILEKGTVILNADNMDITKIALKKLNKSLPKIKVEFDE